ncbi:MAG TPA: hypothetical protein VMI31_19225 [Fimbriimonadaceae bacterium]|nr:hypothetical protein [Fimbriimonadaceae bacterium]
MPVLRLSLHLRQTFTKPPVPVGSGFFFGSTGLAEYKPRPKAAAGTEAGERP